MGYFYFQTCISSFEPKGSQNEGQSSVLQVKTNDIGDSVYMVIMLSRRKYFVYQFVFRYLGKEREGYGETDPKTGTKLLGIGHQVTIVMMPHELIPKLFQPYLDFINSVKDPRENNSRVFTI